MNDNLTDVITKLEGHIKDDDVKHQQLDERYDRIINDMERSTSDMQGIVDAWKAVGALQKFIKWLSTFAVLAIIGTWLANHIKL